MMDQCKILVLDEGDKLLSQDFNRLFDKLISVLPPKRQILLYSGTFPGAGKSESLLYYTVESFMVSLFKDTLVKYVQFITRCFLF